MGHLPAKALSHLPRVACQRVCPPLAVVCPPSTWRTTTKMKKVAEFLPERSESR
jgi:hypothetical protein